MQLGRLERFSFDRSGFSPVETETGGSLPDSIR